MGEITHLDNNGHIRMVDVSGKLATIRQSVAEGYVIVGPEIINAINDNRTPKGNVLETARLAGIMGAKRTSDLIPLCHPLLLNHVQIDFEVGRDRIRINASVSTNSTTGVEMEALTATTITALAIYDMLKALSHSISIESIRLLAKSGGKSGDFRAAGFLNNRDS